MPIEVVVPRLGWSMEEGTLVEWLKKDGDIIQTGDLIYTLEGDKALNEVETFESGILRIPPDSPRPGTTIPVGTVIAYVLQPGEPAPWEQGREGVGERGSRRAEEQRSAGVEAHGETGAEVSTFTSPSLPLPPSPPLKISPRARRIATELGVDWHNLTGSGRTGRIVERDIVAAHQAQVARATSASPAHPLAVDATPVALRVAAELGIDINILAAQMPGRRIERADVERAAAPPSPSNRDAGENLPSPSGRGVGGEGNLPSLSGRGVGGEGNLPSPSGRGAGGEGVRLSPTRRLIAERMSASAHTTAPVTLTTEVDATELVRLRHQLKADQQGAPATEQPVPSYSDLLVKITAHALQEHPVLNAPMDGDTIITEPAAHIGIAVDTDRGLMVVVVRNAQTRSLRQIAQQTSALIARARAGTATVDDLKGSTFTITNLGMYEIDAFSPIINLPECAILGIGRVVPKQVVVLREGSIDEVERVAVRHMLALSLTFDHRLVDGAPAARFLQRIKQLVERPYLWLVN